MKYEDENFENLEKVFFTQEARKGFWCAQIEGDEVEVLRGYYSVWIDLNKSKNAIEALKQREPEPKAGILPDPSVKLIEAALYSYAILFYMKCFSEKDRKNPEESRSTFLKIKYFKNNKKYLDTHEYVKNIRDAYLAHSGASDHEELKIYARYSGPQLIDLLPNGFHVPFDVEVFLPLLDNVNFLIDFVVDARMGLEKKIVERIKSNANHNSHLCHQAYKNFKLYGNFELREKNKSDNPGPTVKKK